MTGTGSSPTSYGSRAFPETFVIDRGGQIAAQRRGPVDQAWLDQTLPPLLRGDGVKLLPLVLVALLLVFATGAAPRTSLPDVEDEVMCVECGTALNVSTSDGRRPGARVHPAPDRAGQGQAADQGRAGRRVRARRARRARRRAASTSPPGSSRSCWWCWGSGASCSPRAAGAARPTPARPPPASRSPTRTRPGSTPSSPPSTADDRRASTRRWSPRSRSASSRSSPPACCRSSPATCRRSRASRWPSSSAASAPTW